MAFRITQKMIRAAEAERGFSKEIRLVQYREMVEWARWNARSPLLTRGEGFRPSPPNFLHALAEQANRGDYGDYERFLHYLGFDVSGDSVAASDERLRITFNPRGANRREWWTEPSYVAAPWLSRGIAREIKRGNRRMPGVTLLDPTTDPEGEHEEKKAKWKQGKNPKKYRPKVLERELREWMLWEEVRAILPPRQAQVVLLYGELYDKDRPRETTNVIAQILGITPSTVWWHRAEALKNPRFRRLAASLAWEKNLKEFLETPQGEGGFSNY